MELIWITEVYYNMFSMESFVEIIAFTKTLKRKKKNRNRNNSTGWMDNCFAENVFFFPFAMA